MLTRRQLRIKVMQTIFYFQRQQNDDLRDREKFLNQSMTQTYVLFLYMSQLLVKIHELAVERQKNVAKKLLASEEERTAPAFFAENIVLNKLRESQALVDALEQRKLDPWELDSKYVSNLYEKIIASPAYVMYTSVPESSYKKDLKFVIDIYQDIIAPSDEILDYLEDKNITWVDDYPLVNTAMLMFLRRIKASKDVKLPELVKETDDIKFTMELFRKTVLNQDELLERLEKRTPNWDKERIAPIDKVLIIMAQSEFLYFPSIPVKVSLNEYLEIAKDYSTPKSSTFINGILDSLLKDFEKNDQINKIGRGLM
ncbi:antitermination protein NusB [Nonlabens spongiae]|uniref:Antitermination protein NusB n=1 Tax=Nonlabens spongiae TaxID=331648 RepID=A0A1W6MGI9_9FLAO|nr:transcription antitermination protein NusB [Nonlabens spongiae]ARN76718.1 antitermination protein NusB [Nonlabens spongiae]